MLSSILSGTFDLQSFLFSLIIRLPIVFIALSLHETAHGYVAYKLGDPTAHNLGRLSLNPLKHIDPIGFLCMLVFGFGWAKPVPINTGYFKKPKRDMALTGAAGPISNILLACIFGMLYRLANAAIQFITFTQFTANVYIVLLNFLYLGVYLNISLAVFNLIPIPPLDGSRIFLAMLPTHLYFKIMKYEKYIYMALVLLLFLGVLDTPIRFFTDLLTKLIL